MPKKKSWGLGKPEEIRDIERYYNITLEEVPDPEELDINPDSGDCRFYRNARGTVTHLTIDRRRIADIEKLSLFKHLEVLSLDDNLIEDISPLASLQKLKDLSLYRNRVKDISILAQLSHLKTLYIADCPIADLSVISQLTQLKFLSISGTGLEDLELVRGLKSLRTLTVSTPYRLKNINALSSLQQLESLHLGPNIVEDLTSVADCTLLKFAYIDGHSIRFISIGVAKQFQYQIFANYESQERRASEKCLEMTDNPLQFPPLSVVELGPETIKEYYKSAERFGHAPLSEGRIIVIGDGAAGKSSLIERLLHDRFEQGKAQTNGIRIENWPIPHTDGRELVLHFWDFGGQEIQHAVHKFFFTSGCLYVLVLDNRKEEDPEYWLQQVGTLGGSAPVLVVFNKQDDHVTEIADRKFLREKYKNIVGFFNVSCKTGFGLADLKTVLMERAMKLNTIDEQFPNNWFEMKKTIEACTSGSRNYLEYKEYQEIGVAHHVADQKTQTLLLKYFTTIGAVTWFGDTYLNFLHVLSPAWITQGVYKIITGRETANASGKIHIRDFPRLLTPLGPEDYTYAPSHYGYILSMMKKFELCYTPDDQHILIPSAFGKMPKVEYSEFMGQEVRTYILAFKDYMPMALIHRFAAKRLSMAYDNNYWYTGIVIKDSKSSTLAMVHADKEAKRIYVRVKGEDVLGSWEYIRRELYEITSSYAKIPYEELVQIEDDAESAVSYADLISFLKWGKATYFHPRLKRDFNVGYLLGLFEERKVTVDKWDLEGKRFRLHQVGEADRPTIINILNNNSSTVNTKVHIDIDIQVVNDLGSLLKGEASYLIGELGATNKALSEALLRVVEFADDAKKARSSGEVAEKGWGRKLKNVIKAVAGGGEQLKHIQDGGESLKAILRGIGELAKNFHLEDVVAYLHSFL